MILLVDKFLVCIGWDFYQMNIKGCLKEQK